MKTIKTLYLFLAASLFSLSACSSSNDDNGGSTPSSDVTVSLSPESVETSAIGGTYSVTVKTSAKEWTAYSSDACSSWITTTPNAQANTITIVVAKNTADERSGAVYFKSGTTRKEITVKQTAPLAVSKASLYFNADGGTDTITVSGRTDWNTQPSADWIKYSGSDQKLTVSVDANAGEKRTGTLTVYAGDEKIEIAVTQDAKGSDEITPPSGYFLSNLVWHDEFNDGTSLNTTDWTHEHQAAGWVNNELQTYSSGKIDGTNITELDGGHLNINCFKAKDGKIYSGRVYAKVSTGWTYGYFEARIKLPKGKGTWPAWWMMPANNNYSTNPWPGCGEIDIMEEVGVDANYVSSTIHCNKYNNGNTSTEHGSKYVATAESEFHVYGCEWNSDYLEFFVDGVSILKYKPSSKDKDYWPFNVAFYPILNLAWGGSWGGYKGVDESALPVQMQVDWVRIWQK